MRDAFGLFRGWCRSAPSCLEYTPTSVPTGAAEIAPLRCARCRCLPQEHVAAREEGYDPHSEEQLRERRKYDERLLEPDARSALHKERADAAFKAKNYRTAYEEYGLALAATPDVGVLLCNRALAYLRVGRADAALADAERAAELAPEWAKARFRLGSCLERLERFGDAVAAFERACELEPENADARRALEAARVRQREAAKQAAAIDEARRRTTSRQAEDSKANEEIRQRRACEKAGGKWDEAKREAFALEWRATHADDGTPLLTRRDPAEESKPAETGEGNGEEEDGLVLEGNGEAAAADGTGEQAEAEAEDDGDSTDSDEAEVRKDRERVLAMAPRNYTLVHEDGRPHRRDDFTPMSFNMQRVHTEAAPEPVWVQTSTARWLQSAAEIVVIAHAVPSELRKAGELRVGIWPRQISVAAARSGDVFLFGELERPIDPSSSTWLTDGTHVTLTLAKANWQLYNPQAKGIAADAHWDRLFTSDQYVERGMIDADQSDLPEHMRRLAKLADLRRKEKDQKERDANKCPICDKDVRFFCACRDGDPDYERPLPDGWKKSGLGFNDEYGNYDLSNTTALPWKR